MTASPTERAKNAVPMTIPLPDRKTKLPPAPQPPLKKDLAGAAFPEPLPKNLRKKTQPKPTPVLKFSPIAWSKLLFLRDRGPTEVGGFAVAQAENPLSVIDVCLVSQSCTEVTVQFDDQGVAEFFDERVDRGFRPEQFARIWVHTHPGDSPHPSLTDEETFARCFGRADWAVMFILARGGDTYARLRFNVGPGGSLLIPVDIDFESPFPASDHTAWGQEFESCVMREVLFQKRSSDPRTPQEIETSSGEPGDPFEDFGFWETGFMDDARA